MNRPEMNDPTGEPLVGHVAKGADAADVADAFGVTWRDIETALTPIIGSKGVAALLERSLHLASAAHPWLAGPGGSDSRTIDLATLKSVVAQQTGAQAALGSRHLLKTFCQLLDSLIGPPLTERMLGRVRADSMGGALLQDTTP